MVRRSRRAAGPGERDPRRGHRRRGRIRDRRGIGGFDAGDGRLPRRARSGENEPPAGHDRDGKRGRRRAQPAQHVRPRRRPGRGEADRGRHSRSLLRRRRARHAGLGIRGGDHRADGGDPMGRAAARRAGPDGDRCPRPPAWPAADRRRGRSAAAGREPEAFHRRRGRPRRLLGRQGDRRAAGLGHPRRPARAHPIGSAPAARPRHLFRAVEPAGEPVRQAQAGRPSGKRHRARGEVRQGGDRRPPHRAQALPRGELGGAAPGLARDLRGDRSRP